MEENRLHSYGIGFFGTTVREKKNGHFRIALRGAKRIIGKSAVNYDSIASILRVLFDKPDEEVVTYRNSNRFIINSRSLETMSMDSLIGLISVMPDDIAYLSYAKIVGWNKIWLTNEAYVMLKDSVYYATYMQPILSRYQGVAVHPEGNNMYRLVCSTEE